jgi:predicted lipid-binding transport protein (Tim44 family)
MRGLLTLLGVSALSWTLAAQTANSPGNQTSSSAQTAPTATQPGQSTPARESASPSGATQQPDLHVAVIPAGSRIPLLLKQAISTKNAREGDSVYAETAFPFVLNDRVLVPAGTYIQGKISHVERAGRVRGRAELLIHFTSLIYPSGYTVMLPASVENTPGAEDHTVKDKEGTIQQDKNTGKRIEDAAKGGAIGTMGGATAGGLATGGLNGARVGAGVGAAAGIAWALLKHGPDVRLDVGTSIEMEVQRDIKLDASRIQVARANP